VSSVRADTCYGPRRLEAIGPVRDATHAGAHVQLCWLALLLIRVVENATGDTWRNTRHELDRMHLVTLATHRRAPCAAHRHDPWAEGDPRRPRPRRATPSLRLDPTQAPDRHATADRPVVTQPRSRLPASSQDNRLIGAGAWPRSAEVRYRVTRTSRAVSPSRPGRHRRADPRWPPPPRPGGQRSRRFCGCGSPNSRPRATTPTSNIKRTARGFRSLANYHRRVLLANAAAA